jgi:hypothetical protein
MLVTAVMRRSDRLQSSWLGSGMQTGRQPKVVVVCTAAGQEEHDDLCVSSFCSENFNNILIIIKKSPKI